MALSRKAKIWLIVLSTPLLVILGGVVVLKMLFTSERLKSYIIPKIEEATHRTVTVNSIDLSLFPTLAIDVEELGISNREGEGFSEKPMLQMDRVVLDVRLLELLKGNVEVSTLTFERPRIFLEVNEHGEANYANPEPASGARDTPRGSEPSAPSSRPSIEAKSGAYGLLLSNLQITNGALEYVDHEGNTSATLQGINQTMNAAAPANDGAIAVELKSTIEQFSFGSITTPVISNLRIAYTQKIRYDINQDVLTVLPGSAVIQEIPMNIRGEIRECTTMPVVDIRIESDKVSIPELLSLVPKEYLAKAEGVKGEGIARGSIDIKGTVTDSTTPDITGMISATNASIHYPQLPKPITNVNIVADFARTPTTEQVRVTNFSASLGDNPMSATLTVLNFDDPALTMSLKASINLAEVNDFYPLEAGTELGGVVQANLNIEGRVSNPVAMKASGSIEFRNVTIKSSSGGNPIRNLNGNIAINNQRIDTRKLSMTLGQSDLSLAFSMKDYLSLLSDDKRAPKPTANLALNSSHLFTADIMGNEESTPATQQHTSPEAGRGQKSAQPARVEVKRSGVPLPNADIDVVATVGTLTMEKFELQNVRGTMKIANGIVNLQSFTCTSFDGSISTKGKLNMQKPARPEFDLALEVSNVDAHAMLPTFTSFGEKMFGKLSMSTTMKGTLDDTLGIVTRGLNGEGRVGVQNGRLTGVKVNREIASFLKLPEVDEVTFKDWANAFTISDGRIVIKDLKIAALGADYLVNGSQGFDGSLDYAVSMLLSEQASAKVSVPGFAGEAAKLFKEPGGRVKLDFAVGGTSDNPKVSLDAKAAQRKAEDLVKQKVNEEGKKLGEEVKKKAGDVLKDLFKKKK